MRKSHWAVEDMGSTLVDENEAVVLRLLRGRYQETKQREEYEKSTAGTGEWLIGHEAYTAWKAEPGQLLWLHGICKSSHPVR